MDVGEVWQQVTIKFKVIWMAAALIKAGTSLKPSLYRMMKVFCLINLQ
jgi:hypothetical protein